LPVAHFPVLRIPTDLVAAIVGVEGARLAEFKGLDLLFRKEVIVIFRLFGLPTDCNSSKCSTDYPSRMSMSSENGCLFLRKLAVPAA
jgi:hypothetical protein